MRQFYTGESTDASELEQIQHFARRRINRPPASLPPHRLPARRLAIEAWRLARIADRLGMLHVGNLFRPLPHHFDQRRLIRRGRRLGPVARTFQTFGQADNRVDIACGEPSSQRGFKFRQ